MTRNSVLVIEDDDDISRNLKDLLESEGYSVELARHGKIALEKLNASPMTPGVILLDLMMPVMDGFQFRQEQVRDKRFAPIPVIVMTADGHIEEKKQRVKAQAFLRKPVDIEELLRIVQECTSRSAS